MGSNFSGDSTNWVVLSVNLLSCYLEICFCSSVDYPEDEGRISGLVAHPSCLKNPPSRRSERYFRRGARLDWPEGATSRESMRAVWKLPRLPNLVMQHVDHSTGDLIDLLQGLLRYDPAEQLKAREALMHPFFTRDLRRYMVIASVLPAGLVS
ncbi:hypothetical protein K2173_011628 [Erythroxylum novogranatense]|uniref:Uncharacterized protein n=1 Tax=Erythroxylum novogranatense TaxID=1862640 RepID=A0AAV8U869_9ROSI|nr:hypothetical protein K2173_011628 [Erythroxylum novogranatense]